MKKKSRKGQFRNVPYRGYVLKWEMFRIGKVPIREVSITECADRGMYSINLNFFYLKISPIEEFGGIFKHHKTF